MTQISEEYLRRNIHLSFILQLDLNRNVHKIVCALLLTFDVDLASSSKGYYYKYLRSIHVSRKHRYRIVSYLKRLTIKQYSFEDYILGQSMKTGITLYQMVGEDGPAL